MVGTGSRTEKRSFSSSLSSSLSSSSLSSCVSLQLKEDDKFFSKLLSRENSSSVDHFSKLSSCSSSKTLYYGGSQGSIPFMWESRPGTPKNPSFYPVSDIVPCRIPPLTPPPSSYSSSSSSSSLSTVPNKNFLIRRKQHNLSLSGMVSRVKSTSGGSSGSSRTRSHTLSLSAPSWTWSGSGSASHSSVSTNSRFSVEQRHSRSRLPSGFLPNVGTESIHVDNSSRNYNNSSRGRGCGKKTDCTHRSPDSTLRFGSRRKHRSSGNKFWACGPVAKVKRVLFSIVGHRSTSRQDAAK